MANALIHHVGAIIKRILTWASNDRATLTVTLNGVDVPSGSKVRKGKALTVRAASKTGYQDAVASANGVLIANDTLIMGKENTTITVDAIPTVYSLTTSGISQYNNVTINRSSVGGPGTYAGATTKNNMTSADNVYYGDGLSFSQSPATGFTGNYSVVNNGNTVVDQQTTAKNTNVNGDIVVSSTSSATAYTLSTNGVNSNYAITVKRDSVGVPGSTVPVSTGTLANNSKVYYGDTLSFSGSVGTGYTGTWSKSGVDSNNRVTGDVTVSSSVTKIPHHPIWMTNHWVGYTSYSSKSEEYSFYKYNQDSCTYASISNTSMTVHSNKNFSNSGESTLTRYGSAAIITTSKIDVTGKTKVQLTFKVDKAGAGVPRVAIKFSSSNANPNGGTPGTGFSMFGDTAHGGSNYSYGIKLGSNSVSDATNYPSAREDLGLNTSEGQTVTMTRSFSAMSGSVYIMVNLYCQEPSNYGDFTSTITVNNIALS